MASLPRFKRRWYVPPKDCDRVGEQTAKCKVGRLTRIHDNHDGVIDWRDRVVAHLLLWVDVNRDGLSEPNELTPVAASGITAISLHTKMSRKRDRWGNEFRYRAVLYCGEGGGRGRSYDVCLTSLPR